MVHVENCSPTFNGCTFYGSYVAGLYSTGTSAQPRIAGGQFASNRYGVYAQNNSRPHIVICCFVGNSDYGVLMQQPTDTYGSLPARDCWWGGASGPSGAGPGAGDAVSSYVIFDDWATYPRCDDYPSPVPEVNTPDRFALSDAYPNPFNPQTTIEFAVPNRTTVSLTLFDISGRAVRHLLRAEIVEPGRHGMVWDARDDAGRGLASGVYFYRLDAAGFSATRRVMLIK